MSMDLALADAANNCTRRGAIGTLTLRSGVQFEGKINRSAADLDTAHVATEDGGWATVRLEELAAVSVRPR